MSDQVLAFFYFEFITHFTAFFLIEREILSIDSVCNKYAIFIIFLFAVKKFTGCLNTSKFMCCIFFQKKLHNILIRFIFQILFVIPFDNMRMRSSDFYARFFCSHKHQPAE